MKSWEALKLLHEGKKVRLETWGRGMYIVLKNGNLCDELGYVIDNPDWFFSSNYEWEEVKDWMAEGIEETKTVTTRICPHCCHKNYAPSAEAKYYIYCSYCGATIY